MAARFYGLSFLTRSGGSPGLRSFSQRAGFLPGNFPDMDPIPGSGIHEADPALSVSFFRMHDGASQTAGHGWCRRAGYAGDSVAKVPAGTVGDVYISRCFFPARETGHGPLILQ